MQFNEVKTFVLPPIEIDDDILYFRVEVIQNNDKYYGQLLRRETYRLEPTFAPDDVFADEQVYVLDYHTIPPFNEQIFTCVDDCLNYAFNYLQEFFNQKIDS